MIKNIYYNTYPLEINICFLNPIYIRQKPKNPATDYVLRANKTKRIRPRRIKKLDMKPNFKMISKVKIRKEQQQ